MFQGFPTVTPSKFLIFYLLYFPILNICLILVIKNFEISENPFEKEPRNVAPPIFVSFYLYSIHIHSKNFDRSKNRDILTHLLMV